MSVVSARYSVATCSLTWNTMRCASTRVAFSWFCSHGSSDLSRTESFDSRTNSWLTLRLAQNVIDAPMTQRSMFFIRSLRSAAAMNSDGSTSWPCSSTMRTSTSNMPRSSPIRLAIGCCIRRKRFSISAARM